MFKKFIKITKIIVSNILGFDVNVSFYSFKCLSYSPFIPSLKETLHFSIHGYDINYHYITVLCPLTY